MVQNSQKMVQIFFNLLTIVQMVSNGSKLSTIVKMVQNTQIWSKICQNCLKWSRLINNFLNVLLSGPIIWSDFVQNGSKCSKNVLKGPKWSKFVPKWSNMVKICQKIFHKITAVGVTAVGVTT